MRKLVVIHLLTNVLPYRLSSFPVMCWSYSAHFITTTFPDILRSRGLEAFFKTAVLKYFTKFSVNHRSGEVVVFAKIKKNMYLNKLFLQEFLKFFRAVFLTLFGQLLPWNKNPSKSSYPKKFLEIATLKYLRKLPGNYPS